MKSKHSPPLSSEEEERIEAFQRQLAAALRRIQAEENSQNNAKSPKQEATPHASDH